MSLCLKSIRENLVSLFVASTVLAFLGYFIATFIVLSRLFNPKAPNLAIVITLGCLGIIGHSYSLNYQLFLTESINFSLPNVIALMSLVITSVITVVALKYKINLLLPVTYGFAAIWQVVLLFTPSVGHIQLTTSSVVLVTHISVALIAYCILVIANLYAFQVSFINTKLKNKNLQAVNQLPPLMQVESQFFMILTIGTTALLTSIMIGFIFLEHFFDKEQLHKTLLSLSALALYAFTLWAHYQKGWRGHKVLSLTTLATTLLTLSYFGSRFVKEFLLS
jgi:ABC-type uncharacterized transport system permease subunit